jgi:hypothetical protein
MKAIEIKITIPESVYSEWWGLEKYGLNKTMEELTSDIETLLFKNETVSVFEIKSNIVDYETE